MAELIPFDKREGWIWMNGELIQWKDAQVHVLNHGLHYASSVFEGERAYNGKIFKSREHSERFHKSAELLGFTIPYSVDELIAAKEAVCGKNGVENGYVRPVAFRGSEMMAISAQKTSTQVVIAAWEWPNVFGGEDIMKTGMKLTMSGWKRPSPESAPTASKAAGLYMICTLSKHAAEAAGFHDALMLDYRGYLAEATGANMFLVIDGAIHTPTPDCFLDGITRRTVIDLAKQEGLEVIERHMQPEELGKASEMFLTGTAAEIKPIAQVDDYHFNVGPVTQTLVQKYHELVRR